MLSLHLEVNLSIRNWYEGFPCKSFSSLRKFIDALSTNWDYNIEEHERKTMIDRIWKENLGKRHAQDDAREGTTYDIPFEFECLDNLTAT